MDTTDKPLTGPESLHLIQQMIQAAKEDLSDNSFDFLFWGWLVLAAALGNYVLLLAGYERPWLPWVTMPLGSVVVGIYHYRQEKRRKVHTPVGDFLGFFWAGMCVLLVMFVGIGMVQGWQKAYPLLIALYGLGTFVSGGVLRFRPLVYGGAACWLLATVAFMVPFQTQLLLLCAAVVVAYIIPGHLLKARFRRGRAV
ncbi:hypothetical protein [Hymenobacter cellulosivorans]|uniref:Uncharacterized protein n=1 Tax=Hymenobacter cellulosivorans TaxID=2932249 RepID=A0ABY4FDE0_9BACT|nr:hypothetical protein [Hymenobacter cellulosivorans]UOQ54698.1 hypothetical protein MUN80_08055 [Hymenobacter cellulosivorans]